MHTLAELKQRGKYVIIKVLGDGRTARRLAETGMIAGRNLTVLMPATSASGMMIHFQGQRLAISEDIAARIVVRGVDEEEVGTTRSLSELAVGRSSIVSKIAGDKGLRRRLLDMGLTKGTMIEVHQVAPLGDPLELIVRGYKLSLRKNDAANVLVVPVEE